MKKKTLTVVMLIIGILLMYFIYSNVDIFLMIQYLFLVLSTKLILYVLVTFFSHFTLAYKWHIILRAMNFNVPIHNLFLYRIAGYAVSYITPSAHVGGEPIRAMLLKRHNIEFSKALSSVVIDKSIDLTFYIFFGLIGLIILLFSYTIPSTSIVVIYSLVFLLVFFLVFYYRMIKGLGFLTPIVRKLKFRYKIVRKIKEFENNISNFFKNNIKVLYHISIISGIWVGLLFLEYTILLNLLNISVTFTNVFLVIIGVSVAYMMPLPAALGSLEAFQITIFKIIKLNAAYAVVASIVIRLKDLFWTAIGLILLSYYQMGIKWFKNDK